MKKSLLFVIGFMLISYTLYAGKKKSISLNLEKGAEFTYEQKLEQDITQVVMGAENKIKMLLRSEIKLAVLEKTKENYTINFSYNKLKFDMESPYFSLDYDSEDTIREENQSVLLYQKMKDLSYDFVVDYYGNVIELVNLKEKVDALFENNEASGNEQLQAQIKEYMGKDAIKNGIESMLKIYPSEKVVVGGEWEIIQDIKIPMPVNTTNHWKFEKMGEGTYEFTGKSDIHVDGDLPEMQGMKTRMKSTGEMKINFILDSSTCLVLNGKNELTMSGTVYVSNEMMPQEMEIPMDVKAVTTYKRL